MTVELGGRVHGYKLAGDANGSRSRDARRRSFVVVARSGRVLLAAGVAASLVCSIARVADAAAGVSAIVAAPSEANLQPGVDQVAGSWSIQLVNSLKANGTAHVTFRVLDAKGQNCSATDSTIGFSSTPTVTRESNGGVTPLKAVLSSSQDCAGVGVRDVVAFDVLLATPSLTIAIDNVTYDIGPALITGEIGYNVTASCAAKGCNPPFAVLSGVACSQTGCHDASVVAAPPPTVPPPTVPPTTISPPTIPSSTSSPTSSTTQRTTTSTAGGSGQDGGGGGGGGHHHGGPPWGLIAAIVGGLAVLLGGVGAWRRIRPRASRLPRPATSAITAPLHVEVRWDASSRTFTRVRGERGLSQISVGFDRVRRAFHLETP